LSSTRAQVCVRAAGPLEARELAAQRFSHWQPRSSTADAFGSPWLDPDLVHCTETQDERLSLIDQPCVVSD
jgi:hypothetical protein